MIHSNVIKKQRIILGLLVFLIMLTVMISMGIGDAALSYDRIIPTLFGDGSFKESFVLFSIRMPRIIITVLAGMALALSGAILQGLTRNDLADPGIIGINSGAGVAVAVFFIFNPVQSNAFVYLLPVVAFIGAFITSLLIYIFSYEKKQALNPMRMIIVGVGFSLALSGMMIVLISSQERAKVDFIAKWLAGNIWGSDWPFILAILPWLIIFIPYALYKANSLNILALNEPVAIGVGVAVKKERILLLFTAVALAASAVSVTGGIAFVGLMAPHIAKSLVGPRNQLFIPVAILLGGWLLLIADTIGKNLVSPDGIPAGIVVALIGAPYFMYLLLRK